MIVWQPRIGVPAFLLILCIAGIEPVRAQSNGLVIVPNRLAKSSNTAQFKNVVRDVRRTGQMNLQMGGSSAALLHGVRALPGFVSQTSSFDNAVLGVFVTDSAQLKASADEIAAIVSNESPDRHSVLYDMQKKYQSSDRAYKLTVPKNITNFVTKVSDVTEFKPPAAVQPLAVNEALASDLKQAARSPTRWLDEKSIQLMASTGVLDSVAGKSTAAAALSKSYANVVNQFMDAIAAPADQSATQRYVDAAATFKSDYTIQWPKIKNDTATRQAAADTYNGLARQRVLKAQYAALTNFPPLSYEQVFYFSRHVVSLRDGGGLICSGIALSKRWIISAGHCFTNRAWGDVRVQFDLDGLGKASRPLRILDLWPEPALGSAGTDPMDFSFLRVEQDNEVAAAFDDLESRIHAQPYGAEPLCLRSLPVTYKQPVFAVGYPLGQAKTVHDYAYVWYPFKIDEDLYNEMEAEIFAQAYKIEKEIKRNSYADSVKKDFEAAYGKTVVEGGKTYHYYFDSAGSAALRPSFGIDTDTSAGDSGSPVFDRLTRCVVGIFSGGQRDTLAAPEVSWREHEIATPISEVLGQIKAANRTQTAAGRVLDQDALAARDELIQRLKEVTDLR
jgi:Trypsin-like peptidase domain